MSLTPSIPSLVAWLLCGAAQPSRSLGLPWAQLGEQVVSPGPWPPAWPAWPDLARSFPSSPGVPAAPPPTPPAAARVELHRVG